MAKKAKAKRSSLMSVRNSDACIEAMRSAIKSAGTQEKLAAEVGMLQGTISNILNHRRTLPADIAVRIHRRYGTDLAALLDRSEGQRPNLTPEQAVLVHGG